MMIVIAPRANSRTDGEAVSAPHQMTSHTVVGMVLGILCLFGLVLAYQLLPRKKKPIQRIGPLGAVDTTPPPSFLQHIRTHCTTFLHKFKPKPKQPAPCITEPHTRSLRTLCLSPESRRRTRERAREMFKTTHRLNISIPPIRNPFTPPHSPRTPSRRLYTPLDDEESIRRPKRPTAALLSPWSPSEQDYPYADTGRVLMRHHDSEPVTPPPIDPPPRVYVPQTPLRGAFVFDGHEEWDKIGSDPFRDSKRDVDAEELIRNLRQRQKELQRELRREGVFIIGEEDDWDSDSDTGSLYSTPSVAMPAKPKN